MGDSSSMRHEALQNTNDGLAINRTKSKKRKLEIPQQESSVKSDAGGDKISKEQRREAKRLKKLEKNDSNGASLGQETGGDNEEDASDKKAGKEARKAEKAQLKAAKKAGKAEPDHETVEIDRKTKKEARKAGKLELKSSGKEERHDAVGPVTNGDTNGAKSSKTKPIANTSIQSGYLEDPALTTLPQSEVDGFLSKNFITIKDPSSSTALRPITQFSFLPSITTTSTTSSVFGSFKTPTPIQAAAWPHLLSTRDVIGVAETGSGKTLAFGVPLIRSIATSPHSKKKGSPAKGVIISPTRELAVQIHTQIEALAGPAQIKTVCVYGGVPKDPQRLALKTAHIVVATPGRLNDLITEGYADLSNVNYVVLDEADRMLDRGFEEEIRKIISTTPKPGRQTLMFTATWPPSVRELASTFMTSPVHIAIGADNPTGELRANKSITQIVEVVDPWAKETRLLQLLKQHQSAKNSSDRILVFALYKKEAARIENFLRTRGLKVAGIHGDMSQVARSASLESFKSGACPLLVATDVAARGLDIPAVKVVINNTFPLTVEDYVHRIGRTGRAGAEGLAVTLFTEHDKAQSGALINVLKAAGQKVPEELLKFGTTVKKKGHEAYGAFYKDAGDAGKKATKIRFD